MAYLLSRMDLFAPTRRAASLTGLAVALAACSPEKQAQASAKPPPARGSLEWAAAGPWRLEPERDRWRHPVETLRFFGLQPAMHVVEVMPGRGWYSAILAPYLAAGGGALIAASFDPQGATDAQLAVLADYKARFMEDPKTFGAVALAPLSPRVTQIADPGAADMVLVMRNVHTFMAESWAQRAFALFFDVLKPGGVLGIEEHRAKSTGVQDPQAGSGYVQEPVVKAFAEEAGFRFLGSSEINANPKDTKDHPFGVWTLPPTLATAPLGMPADPHFDSAKYKAIGESDRMTLKFLKPGADPAAPPPG